MTPADRVGQVRALLAAAREHLAAADQLLDEVAPTLPEFERGAVVLLKTDVSHALERLSNVIRFPGLSCAPTELMGGSEARPSDRVGFAPRGSDPWARAAHQLPRSDRDEREQPAA